MKGSADLFLLIKSLTKTEKRYFKLFSSLQHGPKQYVRLFDAVDRQEVYDEEAIRAKFAKETIGRQLHAAKHHLHGQILKSLRFYYSGAPPLIQTHELLVELEILYHKGLFKQARKALNKLQAIAARQEDSAMMLNLIDWRVKLSGKEGSKLERLDDLYRQRKDLVRRADLLIDYEYIGTKLGNLIGNGLPRTPQAQQELEDVMAHPALTVEPDRGWFRGYLNYNWTYATYYYSRNEYPEALRFSRAIIDRFHEEPERIADRPIDYLATVNNTLILLHRLGYPEQFEEMLATLKQIYSAFVERHKLSRAQIANKFLSMIYLREMLFRIDHGEFERCVASAPEIDERRRMYQRYDSDDTSQRVTDHLLSYAHLVVGDLDGALRYINRVISRHEPQKGKHVYYSARLFALILHYEMGNFDLLESLVRSNLRLLRTRGAMYRAEQAILAFFQRILRDSTPQSTTEALTALRAELDPLTYNIFEYRGMGYFDMIAWLNSKIHKKPIREFLQANPSSVVEIDEESSLKLLAQQLANATRNAL